MSAEPSSLSAARTDPSNLPSTVAPPVTPHRRRFRITLTLLGLVAVAAVAVAIAVASNGNTHNGVSHTGWSGWEPSNGGSKGISQIADHVGLSYLTSTGTPIAEVLPASVTDTDISTDATSGSGPRIVLDPSSSSSSSASSSQLELLGGNTVDYNVCGLGGSRCELAGTPSAARLLLLRREALELALYTFQYISGVDNVFVVLPPGRTETTKSGGKTKPVTISVLFVKKQLQQFLNAPFSRTLTLHPPNLSQLTLWSGSSEAGLVNELTVNSLFSEQIETQQQGGRLLVLHQLTS
jgi:hypothetical protein